MHAIADFDRETIYVRGVKRIAVVLMLVGGCSREPDPLSGEVQPWVTERDLKDFKALLCGVIGLGGITWWACRQRDKRRAKR